jgi:HK97 family phage major capsid protein
MRDTIISTDAKGGYLITPTQISADIVSVIQDMVFIRQLCDAAGSVTTVTDAKKLGIRKRTAHMADADWTTEVAGVTEDTTRRSTAATSSPSSSRSWRRSRSAR